MTRQDLFNSILKKKSFLCVGLDSDITKIPCHLLNLEFPIFEFNKQIIDATIKYTVAYKPNLAFYESLGVAGWIQLEKTISYLNSLEDKVFIIADAKRGDIGNTSKMYAKAFFNNLKVDAVTVAPYMGKDSVTPFLGFDEKWVVLLALTSNEGADDFQVLNYESENKKEQLFETVLRKSSTWGTNDNMMYVVGATRAEMLEGIRKIVPEHFLLIPGVGAQGGSLSEVAKYGINKQCGLLVNASRSIIYASSGIDFAALAALEAASMQKDMQEILTKYGIQ
ncbi:MAG: orotidine-5'-phosphate decarboxylase [Bacteroidetes bacterium]|nr:orotidine-5'-phosphate decarboxylase [Bacteroidota bacterium]